MMTRERTPSAPVATAERASSVDGRCTVDLVSEYDAFLALESVWNDAAERAGVAHPFLRHEWVRTWWDAFGGGAHLHVLVVRIDGCITASAARLRESASDGSVRFGSGIPCLSAS